MLIFLFCVYSHKIKIDDLKHAAETLGLLGKGADWVTGVKQSLSAGKQYLKSKPIMKCFAKICNPYKYTCVKHLFVYLVRILSGMSYSCTADTVFHFFDLFHQIVSCEPSTGRSIAVTLASALVLTPVSALL